MKVYKLEVLIIDFDEVGEEGIIGVLENANYPNDCISPEVKKIESREIGEWDDDNPLNNTDTADEEYERLFSS